MKFMKKSLIIILAFVMTMCLTVKADNDRVITFEQLPAEAQTMLKSYFADKVPLVITVDWDDYTVIYQSGEKVEFDKKGNWKDLNCKTSAVPTALIPEQIKLDRDRRGYDVKLNNGMELEFNKNFEIVDIDD